MLHSGERLDVCAIERHYQQSPFIRELCVLAAADDDNAGRPYAVVVPDRETLRRRKIVNVRELVRFELEGLSIALPPHQRVVAFEVTMAPLPRTATGEIDRNEVLRRRRNGAAAQPDVSIDPHVAAIVAYVQRAVRPGVAVRADSNLELDLDLDSMERVELLASLEQRFGVGVADDVAQAMFVVRDVAEAFRGATDAGDASRFSRSALLDREPDADLASLLKPRFVTALAIFVGVRVIGVLTGTRASGTNRLPRRGPFIISPNHQSYVDPFVVMSVLPFRVLRQLFFVGATEYFETPLTRWLARRMNIVPVDPDANLLAGLRAGTFGLRHGKVLMLFPEGERSIDGGVKTFRKGAAILSRHLDVPIVPVAIAGMFEIWPRGRSLAWRRLLPWSGHRVRLRFGEPMTAGGDSDAALTTRVREAVSEMWGAISASGSRSA